MAHALVHIHGLVATNVMDPSVNGWTELHGLSLVLALPLTVPMRTFTRTEGGAPMLQARRQLAFVRRLWLTVWELLVRGAHAYPQTTASRLQSKRTNGMLHKDPNHGQKLDHVDASTTLAIQIMYFSMMIPSVGATPTIGSSARLNAEAGSLRWAALAMIMDVMRQVSLLAFWQKAVRHACLKLGAKLSPHMSHVAHATLATF